MRFRIQVNDIGIERPNDVVKTEELVRSQDKYGGYPITDHAATGIEMARI
jgi:hypothetical protein